MVLTGPGRRAGPALTRVAVFLLAAGVLAVGGPVPTAEPAPDASPTPVAATPAPPASFTLLATGDVLVHQSGSLVAGAAAAGRATGASYDFSGVLAPVAPLIGGADVAICHLETPVAPPGGPFRGYPSFSVQPEILDALAGAGYDTCSTASNHALDAGAGGLARTLDAMDAAGLGHTGTFRSEPDSRTPKIIDVRGVRVGHIAWTYGLNGIPLPAGRPWSVNVFDTDRPDVGGLLADAARARQAGADVVVASVHCCAEYRSDPTPAQVRMAQALLAAPDIDLVLGHHAHVVQPFEKIDGEWVAYGLGNHIAQQRQRGETQDSVVARFTFTRGSDGRFAVTRAEAIPTRIELGPAAATVAPTGGRRAAVEVQSHARVTDVLGRRGAVADGLVIANS